MNNRQWRFAEFPDGKIAAHHFKQVEEPVKELDDGEVLVQQLYLSLIPATRAWMNGRTYRDKLEPGDVMPGRGVGRIIKSRNSELQEGQLVENMKGWQDYAVCRKGEIVVRDQRRPPEHQLGILGTNALTAYFGLLHVGKPIAGETILVSAAAGGIGSLVSQLGRIAGCRVIGIAGGSEKCSWLRDATGVDEAVDYKSPAFSSALTASCGDGVNLFFDNTGGPILEAALQVMRTHGRIVCCGNTSQYDTTSPDAGPRGVPLTLIVKSLTMTGFVMMSFLDQRADAEAQLWRWYEAGQIKAHYHIVDGLERAPEALVGLLAGANKGLTLVKI